MSRWLNRGRAADVGLAAVCVVAGVWPGLQSGLFEGSPFVQERAPLAVNAALGIATGAAVFGRRKWPLLLSAGALLSWAVAGAYPALLIAQYAVGAHVRSARLRVVLTVVTVAAVCWPMWRIAGGDASIPLGVLLCILPVLVGLYLTSRRELVANLEQQARRNEQEERLRIEAARAEERAQIARDMHDVVTHRVSLMVLHATALQAADGGGAVAIAGQIQGIGRAALDELRTLVGVLRDDTEVPLRPQPGLTDLPDLVDASRSLGLTVELSIEDGLRPPSLVGHAVYRVVQEALTNTLKHAGPARAWVQIRWSEDELRIEVANNGRNTATGTGYGHAGMRERMRLYGGRLESGPRPDGGYVVRAYVPIGSAG